MTQEDRNPSGYFYATNAINWIFFGSSAVLLLVVVWMVWFDWRGFRDWKQYQEEFQRMQAADARNAREEARAHLDPARVRELSDRERAARKGLRDKKARLEEVEAQILPVAARVYKSDQLYKFAKAEGDKWRYEYEESLAHEGAASGKTRSLKKRLGEAEGKAADCKLELEGFLHREAGLSKARSDLLAELDAIEKERKKLFEEVTARERALAKVDQTPATLLLNAPFLDAVAPTLKIRQWVTEELVDDYHFTKVQKVDRCITCHVAIDRKEPEFRSKPQPFRSHPRLDLFVAQDSKHPAGKSGVGLFGCTVCHGGRPSAVEFVYANHTPSSPKQAQEWKEEYGWHADLEGHEWEHPMLPGKFLQSSCYKCHKQEDDLKGAPVLGKGKAAFQRFGCYGCHKTEGFESAPRLAPDLTHLAAKTAPDWAFRWIENPKAFRPDTTMPRFFGLSNAATEEDRKRENAHIAGIVSYLFHFSGRHLYSKVPAGEAARGREQVRTLGCLGCHTVEGQGPDHPPRLGVPGLDRVGEKTSPEWLYHWLKDPVHYYPDTRMPDLRLSDQEAADVTAYLMTLKKEEMPPFPPPASETVRSTARLFLEGRYPVSELEGRFEEIVSEELTRALASIVVEEAEPALAFALGDPLLKRIENQKDRMSRELATLYQGRISQADEQACKRAAQRARQLLAAISDDAVREALRKILDDESRVLYRYVEGAPVAKTVRDRLATRSLQTVIQEVKEGKGDKAGWSQGGLWTPPVEGLVAHLLRRYGEESARLSGLGSEQRRKLFVGQKSLTHFGCAGCHQVPGVERGFGIGVELSGSQPIGSKSVHMLDFGMVPIEHSRSGFIVQKLANPRIYDLVFAAHGQAHGEAAGPVADAARAIAIREKKPLDKLRMPNFEMAADDAEAIATFVLGLVRDPIPASYLRSFDPAAHILLDGRKILDRYNCQGCHMLERDHLVLDYDTKDPATGRKVIQRVTVEGLLFSQENEEDETTVEYFKPVVAARLGEFVLDKTLKVDDLKILAVNPRFVDLRPAKGGGLGRLMERLFKDAKNKFVPIDQGPPILEGEGRKVHVGWLYDFLKSPYEIRPAVWPRMPTFGFTQRELNTVSNYFAHADGLSYPLAPEEEHPFAKPEFLKARADRLERVRQFVYGRLDKTANFCTKCHVAGNILPAPADAKTRIEKIAWSPDMAKMARRLKPDWILYWLHDPSRVTPGSKMMAFPRKDLEKYGFTEEDVLAFLLNFHKFPPPASPPQERK